MASLAIGEVGQFQSRFREIPVKIQYVILGYTGGGKVEKNNPDPVRVIVINKLMN